MVVKKPPPDLTKPKDIPGVHDISCVWCPWRDTCVNVRKPTCYEGQDGIQHTVDDKNV